MVGSLVKSSCRCSKNCVVNVKSGAFPKLYFPLAVFISVTSFKK